MRLKIYSLLALLFLIHANGFCQAKTVRRSEMAANMLAKYETKKLKLPGDDAPRDYFVKTDGDYYILNGDILIPKNPGIGNIGVSKQYMRPDPDCKNCSVTIDDSHAFLDCKNYKWNNGMIPVEIDASVFSTNSCAIVKDALEYMNANTGLVFYPRKSENDFVSIIVVNGNQGGNSPVGRQGGKQILRLFTGNFDKFTLCHELMHACGVYHEQGRKDRDNFIRINFDNITDDQKHNFQIEDNSTSHGAYDYCSIMHYPGFIGSMAIDKSKPIITCSSTNNVLPCPACMGVQNGLTDADKQGLQVYYAQIGVSRFPSNQTFDMGCKGTYLAQKTATDAMLKLNNNADIRKLTGGITIIDVNTLATYVPGNPNDADGFFIPGHYNGSYYYYSVKTGLPTAQGSVISKTYVKLGIGNPILGWPEGSETPYLNGAYQIFNHGYMYTPPASVDAFFIRKGPIYDKWANVAGGVHGNLGWPEMNETLLPDGKGYFMRLNHGHIYWSPAHGAMIVKGKIFDTWAGTGWEKGKLGYPISDYIAENASSPSGAKQTLETQGYQKFEGGIIFSTVFTGGVRGTPNETTSIAYGNPEILLKERSLKSQLNSKEAANAAQQNPATNKVKNSELNKKAINPQPLPPNQNKQ